MYRGCRIKKMETFGYILSEDGSNDLRMCLTLSECLRLEFCDDIGLVMSLSSATRIRRHWP